MYFSTYVFILNVLYDLHCDFWHFLLICDTGRVICLSIFVHIWRIYQGRIYLQPKTRFSLLLFAKSGFISLFLSS